MRFTLARTFLNVGVSLALAAGLGGAFWPSQRLEAANVSKQQADLFARKLAVIASSGASTPTGRRRTQVTEGELNSWFAYHEPGLLPTGVTAPQLTIVGNGKVAGQAVVDLEVLGRRRASGGVLDPWSFLTGKVPVRVVGALRAVNGMGRFDMESADVSGVPIPKTLLQQLVSHYSRSTSRPDGIGLDDTFPLPARIQEIEVGQGQAVVVQ
ncbi:MAG: hypothetical protein ABL993_04775 [Vicinamibacterales bacterium]